MPSKFGPRLPLAIDKADGVILLDSYKESIKQEFKNLMLTSPGERIWRPEYGVGLRRLLFEKNVGAVHDEATSRISEQVSRWMPIIKLHNVQFLTSDDSEDIPVYALWIIVRYTIVPLGVSDSLILEENTGQF